MKKESGEPYKKIIINIPPQHGKTRTLINFCQWTLGINPTERIIAGSYNDDTASDFSRYTRDGIQIEKFDPNDIVYTDVFPDSRIKKGHGSFQKWALVGQHFNYLGAGIGGSITSKGATILIIDDPIKGAIEALNDEHLKKVWLWYTGTFLSRVSAEGGEPLEIIIMTPWSKKDLCGRILSGQNKKDWYVLKMPAYNKQEKLMLCPSIFSKKRYDFLKSEMPREIFSANYDMKPLDQEGRLYKTIKTYIDVPRDLRGSQMFKEIRSYTDTADEGSDYLCHINYGVTFQNEAYILDVVYTKEPMEITEPIVAESLNKDNVLYSKIESNNGGKGFARNIRRILQDDLKNQENSIEWFHQSENKIARILTHATFVQNHIYFPVNWADRWSEFFEHVTTFQKEGKNQIDDAPDCLTGIAENFDQIHGAYVGDTNNVDPD